MVKEQKFKLSKCKNVNTLQTQKFENGPNTKCENGQNAKM